MLLLTLVAVQALLILAKPTNYEVLEKRSATDKNSKVCLTEDCAAAAARIDSYIDYNVSECDDFYQFSCGNWTKQITISEDFPGLDTFKIVENKVETVLKNLLEEDDSPTDLGFIKKARDFYRSCMNLDLINSNGDQPLKDLLNQKFGGWPLTTPGWSENSFDFVQTMVQLNSYSSKPVINMYADIDTKNTSRKFLMIYTPSISMPGQNYLLDRNDTILMAYQEFIFNVGKLLGFADPNTAHQEVVNIVDFEIQLANISTMDTINDTIPMTLAEVHGNYSKAFDWRSYVHALLSKPEIGPINVTDDEVIINKSPLYYQRLNNLIAVTPKRTLANYLIWRFVRFLTNYLPDSYPNSHLVYIKAIDRVPKEHPRFKICVSDTTSFFRLAVGRLFIKDNFHADSKTITLEMIRELQNSFNEGLDHLDWMDEHTKKVTKEKIDLNGNFVQSWNLSTIEKFKEKSNCIVEQYGNFTVPEINMKVNGMNTINENIADSGGLKQAFAAYRNWVDKQGKEEPLLPGLNFTNNQLFFINFAQSWCRVLNDEIALNQIYTSEFSPNNFRVIGSIQNSPDFAKVFNCPIDSYMNPKKKCNVW